MSHMGRKPLLGLLTVALCVGLIAFGTAGATAAPGDGHASSGTTVAAASSSICTSATRPKLAARISRRVLAALATRTQSVVGLKVTDPNDGLTCKLHQGYHFDSASVIKVTIISALLLKEGGARRLTPHQRTLAWNMITLSDNDAATALWNQVGMTNMQVFLNKAGMTHTFLNVAWGLTQITAQDEIKLLQLLTSPGKVLNAASRRYVLYLMAHVVSYERWGVSAGAPASVTIHIKNGWLPDPGTDNWHINSIGAFTGVNVNYQIVILTYGDQSESYGIDTIQAAAGIINRQIAGTPAPASPANVAPSVASLTAPGG
jgi:hypothetical protein